MLGFAVSVLPLAPSGDAVYASLPTGAAFEEPATILSESEEDEVEEYRAMVYVKYRDRTSNSGETGRRRIAVCENQRQDTFLAHAKMSKKHMINLFLSQFAVSHFIVTFNK